MAAASCRWHGAAAVASISTWASQLIVDGQIAVRNSAVDHFAEAGIVPEDGTELEASVIVMATSYTGMRDTAPAPVRR
jgi:hypothetical protein